MHKPLVHGGVYKCPCFEQIRVSEAVVFVTQIVACLPCAHFLRRSHDVINRVRICCLKLELNVACFRKQAFQFFFETCTMQTVAAGGNKAVAGEKVPVAAGG